MPKGRRTLAGGAPPRQRVAAGTHARVYNVVVDEDLKRLIESTAIETRRHFDVVAEQVRSDVKISIEAASSASDKVDRLAVAMREEFGEVKSMIRLSYSELDRRLRTLEEVVSSLQARVERLESDAPSAHS